MNDLVKKLGRGLLTAVLWVFILSINVGGRSIFSYANEVLVQNSFVRMLDEELAGLWDKVYTTAQRTFSEERTEDEVF